MRPASLCSRSEVQKVTRKVRRTCANQSQERCISGMHNVCSKQNYAAEYHVFLFGYSMIKVMGRTAVPGFGCEHDRAVP